MKQYDFLHSPLTFTRTQRTSRDVCREAASIERPASNPIPRIVRAVLAIAAFAGIGVLLAFRG